MDKFQTFETGNRKKFVDLAKKKKEIASQVLPFADERLVILMQANIRRFLAVLKTEQIDADWSARVLSEPPAVVMENLSNIWANNKMLFNRCHKLAVARVEAERSRMSEKCKDSQIL